MSTSAKTELHSLQSKMSEVTQIAIEIDHRQKRIIQTAQSVNSTIKNGIEGELNGKKAYEDSMEKTKSLRNRIDNSKSLLDSIRKKLKKVQEKLPKEQSA